MKTYIVSFEIPHAKLETIVALLSGEIDHFNVREKDPEPLTKTSSRNRAWTLPIRKKLRALFDSLPDHEFHYQGAEIKSVMKECGYNPEVASTALSLMKTLGECRRTRRGYYCSKNRRDG